MIRPALLLGVLCLGAASLAMPAHAAGPTPTDIWQVEACGNDPTNKCERAFIRRCGKTPNAACVKRHQKEFDRLSRSGRRG